MLPYNNSSERSIASIASSYSSNVREEKLPKNAIFFLILIISFTFAFARVILGLAEMTEKINEANEATKNMRWASSSPVARG